MYFGHPHYNKHIKPHRFGKDGDGAMKGCAALLLAAMLLVLCGCGGSRGGLGQLGTTLDDWRYNPSESGAEPVELEVLALESPDFAPTLGFDLTLPLIPGMKPVRYFSISGWVAQVEFESTTDTGRLLVLRAAPPGHFLADTFPETHNQGTSKLDIDGIEVRPRTAQKGCAAVFWQRDGYQFVLHSRSQYGMPSSEEIEAAVRGTTCVPAAE